MILDFWTPLKNMNEILKGLGLTVVLTIVVTVLALIVGIVVGYIRFKKTNILYQISTVYVEIIRNTPFLVQIFLIYYGLPQFHIILPAIPAAILALTINQGAYIAEIVKGGIFDVPQGQWEAAGCIGFDKPTIFMNIILPQTIRDIFPTLINQFIIILYCTTLLSACDVREMFQTVSLLGLSSLRVIEYYVVAAVFYLVLSNFCTWGLGKINRKYFPSIGMNRR